jgi:eukaryotic-like serine/threonine-protein kinase
MRVKTYLCSARAACILLTVIMLAAVMVQWYPLQLGDSKLYDWMSSLRVGSTDSPVVIVAVDEKSIHQLGDWPWPRSYIADIIQTLSRSGAHTLGISLLYPERESNFGLQEIQRVRAKLQEDAVIGKLKAFKQIDRMLGESEIQLNNDDRLISVVLAARNVVLPLIFEFEASTEEEDPEISAWLTMNSLDLKRAVSGLHAEASVLGKFRRLAPEQVLAGQSIIQPYNDLSTKAGALGYLNLTLDGDGVIRKLPLVIDYEGRGYLSFGLQIARKYLGLGLNQVRLTENSVRLMNLEIPVDGSYNMLVNYDGAPDRIPTVSAADVLNGSFRAETLRRKIVLLGLTAPRLIRHYATPVQAEVAPVEIFARQVDNLVTQHLVSRPVWTLGLEMLAVLYFGLFLVFVIPRAKPRVGLSILAILLITWIATAAFLFITFGYWVHIVGPALLAVVGFAVLHRETIARTKTDESVELNRSLGLALQGQGLLDMAFERFVKCPLTDVTVKELLYNLGLDFERKRMFNKALAVYEHIFQAGRFKDIEQRIQRFKTIESTLVFTKGAGKSEPTLLLDDVTAAPTLGRYEILKELGRGAMGTVYLGRDPSINRDVAIKTLNYAAIEANELENVKSRFFREAEAAGKLSHPNIVTIFDVGEDHDMAYMAMELLKGNDLSNYCRKENLLPATQVMQLAASVADALDYAHNQGVVHRDIKPANMILLEINQVKVADFGIARVMSASNTQTGIILGTPNYMSPEQVAGKKVDGRSDLFSLGVVLYELLSGQKPFQGDSLESLMHAISNGSRLPVAEVAPDAPACFAEIVEKLLEKALTRRFKSAAQARDEMRNCLANLNLN